MLVALDGSPSASFGNDAADVTRWLRDGAAQAVLPEVTDRLGTGSDAQQAVMAALSDCAAE